MSEALTSDNFNEHDDCVMVGHRWAKCECEMCRRGNPMVYCEVCLVQDDPQAM